MEGVWTCSLDASLSVGRDEVFDESLQRSCLAFGSPASLDLTGGIENVVQESGELGEITHPIV